MRRICDHVLEQSIEEDPRRAAARNIAYLTERRYFESREADLLKLLEFIADERIVSLLSHIAGEMPLFHNTQYFHNPTQSHDGEWHRDTQFLAADEALERQRMKQHTGVHFRVAFLPDRQLEYVPGSEQRWDTSEELEYPKGRQSNSCGHARADHDRPRTGRRLSFSRLGNPSRNLPSRDSAPHAGYYLWLGRCVRLLSAAAHVFYGYGTTAKLSPGTQDFFGYFIRSYETYWKQSSDAANIRAS